MTNLRTSVLLAAAIAGGNFATEAHAASALSSLIQSVAGPGVFVGVTLNDDDQATFIDNTPDGPTVDAPVVVSPGTTIEIPALATGDEFQGFVLFPSIDVSGADQGPLPGFELTGTYTINVGDIDFPTSGLDAGRGVASVTGSLSLFEDSAPNADFLTGLGFGDGDLLGTFNLTGSIRADLVPFSDGTGFGIPASAAGAVPAGASTGGQVELEGVFDSSLGGLFADPSLFVTLSPFTTEFDFGVEGPLANFDFGSDGGVNFVIAAVPSPAAAGIGVLGLFGFLARRRRFEDA